MIEYLLRRLPTPESVRQSWLFACFGSALLRPDYWLPSRHTLALGIGLGWFIGLLPLFGFHAMLALSAGALVRCHLPSVVLGTFISNLFTLPGILALQYLIGRWICLKAGLQAASGFAGDALLAQHFTPLLVGSVTSALVAGVAGYSGVWIILGWKEKSLVGGVV
jgi:uncharacterized protein (DUF2062 family)